MTAGGEFHWPSAGTIVAAYGEFFMAADTNRVHTAGAMRS